MPLKVIEAEDPEHTLVVPEIVAVAKGFTVTEAVPDRF